MSSSFNGYFFTGVEGDRRGQYLASGPNNELVLRSVALAENYRNKESGMNGKDVHWEFTDFIVESALWHKSIDRSIKEFGPVSQIDSYLNQVAELLGWADISNPNEHKRLYNGSYQNRLNPRPHDTAFPSLHNFYYSISGDNLPNNLSTGTATYRSILDKLRAVPILGALYLVPVALVLDNVNNGALGSASATSDSKVQALTKTIADAITDIVFSGYSINIPYFDETGAPGTVAKKYDLFADKSPEKLLHELLSGTSSSATADVIGTKNWIASEINTLLISEVESLYQRYANVKSAGDRQAVIDNTAALRTQLVAFVKSVKEHASRIISSKVAQRIDVARTTLNNPGPMALYNKLIALTPDQFSFFADKITLFKKRGNEWAPVTTSQTTFPRMNGGSPSEYRLNLIKNNGANPIAKLLPNLSGLTGVWYHDNQKSLQYYNTPLPIPSDPTQSFFQKLYLTVYESVPQGDKIEFTFGTQTLNLPSTLEQSYTRSKNTTSFSTNDSAVISNEMKQGSNSSSGSSRFYEYMEDTYNRKFSYDNGVLMMDGRPFDQTYPNHTNPENSTCGSSFAFNDAAKCKSYFQDVLLNTSGSTEDKIDRCLGYLSGLGNIKIDSLRDNIAQQMHPEVALKTLRALNFGKVKRYNSAVGSEILMSQSVNEWCDSLDKKAGGKSSAASKVRSSEPIRTYLSLVVNFLNTNPVILNPDLFKTKASGPDELEGKIKLYREPPYRQQLVASFDSLKNYFLSYGSFRPIQLGGGLTHIKAMNTIQATRSTKFAPKSYQKGGGYGEQYKASSDNERTGYGLLKRLYEQVKKDLEHRGKTIGPDSSRRITDLLTKFKDIETEVSNSVIQLEKYLTLVQGVKDYNPQTLEQNEIQELVRKHKDLEEKFRKTQMNVYNVMYGLVKITNNCDDPVSTKYASTLANKRLTLDNSDEVTPL